MIVHHGGCVGCLAQNMFGVDYCDGCKYQLQNWDLPDLSIVSQLQENVVMDKELMRALEDYIDGDEVQEDPERNDKGPTGDYNRLLKEFYRVQPHPSTLTIKVSARALGCLMKEGYTFEVLD